MKIKTKNSFICNLFWKKIIYLYLIAIMTEHTKNMVFQYHWNKLTKEHELIFIIQMEIF